MANPYFKFKQFTVWHDQCAMKVGTDGVLLGAWANAENASRILDIGTGTGLIALMLAQRSPAYIEAVEIEEKAFGQASRNIAESPWENRIKVFHCAVQEFEPEAQYDLITSNPPYFQESLKNPQKERSLARHTDNLSYNELITFAVRWLKPNGRLAVILPSSEKERFSEIALGHHLFCIRLTRVIPRQGLNEKRVLMEFSQKESIFTESELIIETTKRHSYSDAYKELTKDFYLDK